MSVYNPYNNSYNVQSIFESTQRPLPYSPSKSLLHTSLPPPQPYAKNIAPLQFSNSLMKPPIGSASTQSSLQQRTPYIQSSAVIEHYENPMYHQQQQPSGNQTYIPVQRSPSLGGTIPTTYARQYEVNSTHSYQPIRIQQDYQQQQPAQYITNSYDARATIPRQLSYQEQPASASVYAPPANRMYNSYSTQSFVQSNNQPQIAQPSYYPQSSSIRQSSFDRRPPASAQNHYEPKSMIYSSNTVTEERANYNYAGYEGEQQQPQVFARQSTFDQSLLNLRIGDLPADTIKRDQHFYHDSYITINGLGTYKKFALKPRKGAAGAAASNGEGKPADRPFAQEPRGGFNQSQQQSAAYAGANSNQDLAANLIGIAQAESALEQAKNAFVDDQECNVPALFATIDSKSSGNISPSEFSESLRAFNINLSLSESTLLFSRVLNHPSALMSYEDFERLCLPMLNNSVRNQVTLRKQNDKGLTQRIVQLFRRVLDSIIVCEQSIDGLRKQVNRSESISIDKFYRETNTSRNNRATISEFENSLLRYHRNLSPESVTLLFYRICLDKSTYLPQELFNAFCTGANLSKSNGYGNGSMLGQSFMRGGPTMLKPKGTSYCDLQSTYSFVERESSDKNYAKIFEKLRQNSSLEIEIERMQQYLHSKRDFKLPMLFKLFRPNNAFIDIYSFAETLKNIFEIPLVDKTDVALIFRKIKSIKSNQKDIIDFSEFCNLFAQKDSNPPREIFEDNGYNDLSNETRSLIVRLIKSHLNNEVIFNEIRLEILSKRYAVSEIFEHISRAKNYLEKEDFNYFLQSPGQPNLQRGNDITFKRFDPKLEGITNLTYFSHALSTRT